MPTINFATDHGIEFTWVMDTGQKPDPSSAIPFEADIFFNWAAYRLAATAKMLRDDLPAIDRFLVEEATRLTGLAGGIGITTSPRELLKKGLEVLDRI